MGASTPRRKPAARLAAVAHCLALLAAATTNAGAFGFDDVAQRAQQLAASAYKDSGTVSKQLAELGYDQYRDIRYRTDRNLWANTGLPFEVAFFHTGFRFVRPVRIHEIDGRTVRDIEFTPALFEYGPTRIAPEALRGAGFAGLRVHYPVNTPRHKDEVLVFLGASYFRAIGEGQVYGASARGLAIDTAVASGEEFPHFIEFWLERPALRGRTLTIYALLDSPRASGAYRFVLRPGQDTQIDVKARLFLRDKVAKLGIAPLTSMYYFGENQHGPGDDFRPEVHDSDGLTVHTATDEWLFRPLTNPKRLIVSSFQLTDPGGFGLTQRDHNFDHYEDLEARYDRRPTVWIEPAPKWGAGRIELIELPTPNETNDNIVAFWVPEALPQPRQPFDFGYRMSWQQEPETRSPQSWVIQSRRGAAFVRERDGVVAFAIDFVGPALKNLPPDAKVEAIVSSNENGRIQEQIVHRNDVTGGYRVALRLQRVDAEKPVELRLSLRNAGRAISETWSYLLPPGT